MPRATRARLPAAERRALIESVAARLFAERGYAATRLEDIADAADVTKPILYRHFSSKKALYLALIARHREGQERAAARAAGGEHFLARAPELLDAWFADVQAHPDTWRMIFVDRTGDAELRAARSKAQANAHALMTRVLADQPDLAFPAVEVEAAAELLRGAMASLALWSLAHPEVDRAILVKLLMRTIRGLSAASPA
jgi:AcrR family transcriptional regulator